MSIFRQIAVPAIAALMATAVVAEDAFAQDLTRGQGVLNRPRPDYDPVGLRAGSFLIFPSIETGVTYDDNIFRTDGNEEEDFIYNVSPQILIESQFANHALNLLFDSDFLFYQDNDSEDTENFLVSADGRLDILRSTNIEVEAEYLNGTEDRGSPDEFGLAAEPTEFDRAGAVVTLNHEFNRVAVAVGGGYQMTDYDDVALVGGGVGDNDDRDFDRTGAFVKVSYEASPGYDVFVRGDYNERDFDDALDRNGLNRDSDGYEVVTGASFDITSLILGEAYIGYQSQSYDDPSLGDIDGLTYGAEINWYVTELTTVRATADHFIRNTTLNGASGIKQSDIELAVDHELLRNLILSGRVAYQDREFEGISREDDGIGFGVDVLYLVNPNFDVEAGVAHFSRDSNATGEDYDSLEFRIALTAKL